MISTKEMREDFSRVKKAMAAGVSLVLLYRSKPLAEIKPVKATPGRTRSFSQKQLRQWIKSDQLSQVQKKQIERIINRLP